jgi:long-chain-fatty-acid--CoA ligase ACSBG
MSECTGATTWSTDAHHIWGSCGWAMNGTELSIRDADSGKEVPRGEQGEVCFRGRHIMLGYMANPDLGPEHIAEIKKKNEEAIDKDGWLHSGDKGKIEANGMCYITGRYKELIIGAGGENVAPVPVEDGVKKRCPVISNVMMVGDKRKFNVCLVTLKTVGATGDEPGTDELMPQTVDSACKTIADASKPSSAIVKAIEAAIVATNKDPECCPMPPSTIKKFTILPSDFSVRTDELTPTFKLKRSVAEAKHTAFIDTMYDDACKTNYVPYKA